MRKRVTSPDRRCGAIVLWAGIVALVALSTAAAAQERPDLYAYGEYLADTCASCHIDSERNADAARRSGIPNIWAMSFDEFSQRFADARENSRNSTMRLAMTALGEADVEALLYYFSVRLGAEGQGDSF